MRNGGEESGLSAGCKEDATETNQNDQLEKWAAKHESEELKEGVLLDPITASYAAKKN